MSVEIPERDLHRVPDAIQRTEKKTGVEIFAVLTRRSDDYRFIAYAFAALWVFLISGILALWIGWQEQSTGWGGVQSYSQWSLSLLPFSFAQILAFVAIIIVMRLFPSLAVAVTPRRIAHERARANGIKQFLAHGIHQTSGRNGALVFVSLDERYAEILVDTALEETLGRDFFLGQVEQLVDHCASDRIIDGYVAVIDSMGDGLAEAFPVQPDGENELADRFVILETG